MDFYIVRPCDCCARKKCVTALSDGKIVVLGGGVSGLSVAWLLAQKYGDRVVVLEREPDVGGLAATFAQKSFRVDLGSHRIHTAYHPEAFRIVKELIGSELLKRPRHGTILINGKFLTYPPSILQICSAFGLRQTFLFAWDYVVAHVKTAVVGNREKNFAGYTIRSVGEHLYNVFYRPYAMKLWGVDPEKISFEPAMHRVKKFEFRAFIHEIANLFRREKTSRMYYYPAWGIGQIANALKQKINELGGEVRVSSEVQKIDVKGDNQISAIQYRSPNGIEHISPALVISTVSLETIHNAVALDSDRTGKPDFDLRMKSLRICYLVTDQMVSSESETLYVPDPRFRIGRVSEIRKYSPSLAGTSAPVITVEVICDEGDEIWKMDDEQLTKFCFEELRQMGVLKPGAVLPAESFSRRVRNLYPIYELGWKSRFDRIYGRLDRIKNLYLVGRPALFLHCNIDHCLVMALRLVELLETRPGDKSAWREKVETFFQFQVKD